MPLLHRTFDLWREAEAATSERLLFTTGPLDGGDEHGEVFQGALTSARLHRLPHEVLAADAVSARFPGYHLPSGMRAVFQPEGGFIASEHAITAHCRAAQASGAGVRARERVLGWEARPGGEAPRGSNRPSSQESLVDGLLRAAWCQAVAHQMHGAG